MGKKLNFSFDVSSLSTYTNELDPNLIQEKIMDSASMSLFNKYPTKTGTNKLNLIDVTSWMQDSTCGLSESGSTTLSQQTLTVEDISIVKSYCSKDLFNYWASQFMSGKFDDLGSLNAQIIEAELKRLADINEVAIWQSEDGGSGGANLDKFDGIIETLSGQSCVEVLGATGVTEALIDDSVTQMIKAVPEAIKQDENLYLFMSPANFQTLSKKYLDTYKYNTSLLSYDVDKFEMRAPEMPNLRIKGVRGLSGSDKFILTSTDNVYVGASEGDEIDSKWEYDNIARKHYFFVDYLMGVQVARANYTVVNFETV